MNISRTLITFASAAALVSAISFAYAQTTDSATRPSTPSTTTTTDTMPNTGSPSNGSTIAVERTARTDRG